jgi:arylsulfatase A-like enzyme
VNWPRGPKDRTTGYINTQIASIPLFIKPPASFRRHQVNGEYQHIDLAPTILDMLGIYVDAHFDGISVFKTTRPTREKLAISNGITWVYDGSKKTWLQRD